MDPWIHPSIPPYIRKPWPALASSTKVISSSFVGFVCERDRTGGKKMMDDKLDLGLSLSIASDASGHNDDHILYARRRTEWPWSSSTATPVMSSSRAGGRMKLFGVHEVEGAPRPLLRVIDVNQKPKAEKSDRQDEEEDEEYEEEEDEGASSSPVSVLSRANGKRSSAERDPFSSELVHHGGQLKRTSSSGTSDEEDGEGSRKKLRLSKEQSAVLEECFKEHNTLNPKQKMALAKQLGLRPRQVEVWFQNRRARTKLKQTEVDCEYLKRWCEKLTEENRRLQKEAAELRALKMMPAAYGHLHAPAAASPHLIPPATLTMCPSCQRVVMPSSPAAPNGAAASNGGAGAKHRGHLFAINGAL